MVVQLFFHHFHIIVKKYRQSSSYHFIVLIKYLFIFFGQMFHIQDTLLAQFNNGNETRERERKKFVFWIQLVVYTQSSYSHSVLR
ncbi:hypothetical protein DERP_008900 [Dermatophagoides pteronyssinus]|uniref:Uncharacterized protein n=1 Tax=Dermatophagoides pteronyssinus TaxID=6956 RepID=A0ABQ8JNH8_DERPT|nr:hypothetical protein DERP_008900 [Dermatophagoides pteronyssinus]